MSLTHRKPRPLNRDVATPRDTRLYIVACDDTYAPLQYFGFFKLTRVRVHVVPTVDGSSWAGHVLERLLEYEHEDDDERWMLLDTDHYITGTHIGGFKESLQLASQKGVRVAISRPCFELWLALHHLDESAVKHLPDAAAVEDALRAHLGEYNKRNLKPEHFPVTRVPTAYKRAQALDLLVGKGDLPQENTTRVYLLWKSILDKSSPSQLPQELLTLLPGS